MAGRRSSHRPGRRLGRRRSAGRGSRPECGFRRLLSGASRTVAADSGRASRPRPGPRARGADARRFLLLSQVEISTRRHYEAGTTEMVDRWEDQGAPNDPPSSRHPLALGRFLLLSLGRRPFPVTGCRSDQIWAVTTPSLSATRRRQALLAVISMFGRMPLGVSHFGPLPVAQKPQIGRLGDAKWPEVATLTVSAPSAPAFGASIWRQVGITRRTGGRPTRPR
jgi:hypothetical protein